MSGAVTSLAETGQSEPSESFNKILTKNIQLNRYRNVPQEYKINPCLMALNLCCNLRKKTRLHKPKNTTEIKICCISTCAKNYRMTLHSAILHRKITVRVPILLKPKLFPNYFKNTFNMCNITCILVFLSSTYELCVRYSFYFRWDSKAFL